MAAPALRLRALPASSTTTTASCSTRAASRCASVPVSVPWLASARTAVCSVARFEARAQGRRVVIANAYRPRALANEGEAVAEGESARGCRVVHGRCFVVGDNIDTDQIIPAEYLTLVPSKPEEYEKLGSYAMIGLPAQWGKFIEEGKMKTEYKVIIGGRNFGCGSSREHAPVALGAAGARAVVAESYARIFFRNSVATGELYPVETQGKIWEENHTGDYVTLDMEKDVLINHTTGKQYNLKPIGEAGPVIDAGGIFAYARSTGMIASPAQ